MIKDVGHATEGTIMAYWPKLCLLREWLQIQYAIGNLDSPLIQLTHLLGEDDDIIEEGARALAEDWTDLGEPTNSALLGSMGNSTVKQWALDRKHMALAPWCDEEPAEEEVKKRSATAEAQT
ncbi:hypothetical protein WJX72_004688 [[Myrmecia] bisecta]|uniref:Uncharacterized protein n=1 Tax=[Myrmecia] bisecta TaxID=41462 RepID=A0AAW1P9T6_9CHLO